MNFFVGSLAVLASTALASTIVRREEAMPVQDGIYLLVDNDQVNNGEALSHPFENVSHTVVDDSSAPSLIQKSALKICEDVTPEHTGFDVHGDDGFMKHASCDDLTSHCHNSSIGEQVRVSCPVACFICMEKGAGSGSRKEKDVPCFDTVSTGIRFREGPKAGCSDLINYCNHTSIGQQVREACRLSCGLCEIHVEGPYLDKHGNCMDLQTHEEPQFTVSGALAGCNDMAQFCKNHPDSYLIRHKCPLSCGVCGNSMTTTVKPVDDTIKIPGDVGGCSRRRRWGFCSTRRRRNV